MRRLLIVAFLSLTLLSCNREIHKTIGMKEGRLIMCPDMPNCLNSMYPDDSDHFWEAWLYRGDREEIIDFLKLMIENEKEAKLITLDSSYIHYEHTIPLFGFVDDVELYLPKKENVIHFRSASRVGYWDVGANKSRMKKIKKKLIEADLIES